MDFTFTQLVLLPVGLGLLGFVEPCSMGSTLLFVKHLEVDSSTNKLAHTIVFAATRALFIGLLGVLAVLLGGAFLGFQRVAWMILGAIYILLGAAYAMGKTQALRIPAAPNLFRVSRLRGSAVIGLSFGLNVPACASPLIFAMLATAAASGATGTTLLGGFISLGLFGLALSLPLVAILFFKVGQHGINTMVSLSERLPIWAGMILAAFGIWSIWIAAGADPFPRT